MSAFSNYKSSTKICFGCGYTKETIKQIKQIKQIKKSNQKLIWKNNLNNKIIECKKQQNDWNNTKNFNFKNFNIF